MEFDEIPKILTKNGWEEIPCKSQEEVEREWHEKFKNRKKRTDYPVTQSTIGTTN